MASSFVTFSSVTMNRWKATYVIDVGICPGAEPAFFDVSFGEWEKIPRLEAETSV
jgi:hypothetical protein